MIQLSSGDEAVAGGVGVAVAVAVAVGAATIIAGRRGERVHLVVALQGGADVGLLLGEPPGSGPDGAIRADGSGCGVGEGEAQGAGRVAGVVGELGAEEGEAGAQIVKVEQGVGGGRGADGAGGDGGETVHDGHGAQEGVEDRAEVVAGEGVGAGVRGVDEEQGAVAGGELDEAVDEEGGRVRGEDGVELVLGRGRDVAFHDAEVDAGGRDDLAGGLRARRRVLLVVERGGGRVEDFLREVVLAGFGGGRMRSARGRRGEVGEVEAAGDGVGNVDAVAGEIRQQRDGVVETMDDDGEHVAFDGRGGQGVGDDFEGLQLLRRRSEVRHCHLSDVVRFRELDLHITGITPSSHDSSSASPAGLSLVRWSSDDTA